MLRLLVTIALTLAAKGLLAAYADAHPGATAPTTGLSLAMAHSIGCEGAWTHYFDGSNNYGSVHASPAFAAKYGEVEGYGMIAMLESASATVHYIQQMKAYPNLVTGARDYLRYVEYGVDLSSVQTAEAWGEGLYSVGYFGGVHEPRTPIADRKAAIAAGTLTDGDRANIAVVVSCINRTLPQAQAAVASAPNDPGDPTADSFGPFASLADRLTPSPGYAPHTMEHVSSLLAATPAGLGVSLAECFQTPHADGVWIFGPKPLEVAGGDSGSLVVPALAGLVVGLAGGLYVVSRRMGA